MSEKKLEGREKFYEMQSNTTNNLSGMYGRCSALLEYAVVTLEGKSYCDPKDVAAHIKVALEELKVCWTTRYEKTN